MQKKLLLIILGTIFVSFALLVTISLFSIRHFGIKNAEEKAEIIAELVQNGLTAHMLSNTMDQREFFLKKIATSKGVESLRIIRSPSVIAQYGEGFTNETSYDVIDEKVLKSGITYQEITESSHVAKLRVTAPYIAKEDGLPNCRSCHQAKEGEVSGAVSMVFDIEDVRINGIISTSTIFGFSLVVMVLVFLIINHSMKPILGLFGSIDFVMNKAKNGDYQRRIRLYGNSTEYHNVALWINTVLDKVEYALIDIEKTVRKFLSINPVQHSDLLLEAQKIVHELSDIYQFKRTIEFDESKDQVYARVGIILSEGFGLRDFMLIESGKNNINPTVVYDASVLKRSISPTCRALRTKQAVYSDQFKNVCHSCGEVCEHYICVPYVISNDFELLLSITVENPQELESVKTKLPHIQNYIDAARPELVSKNLMEILKISSTTDALTGLFNRKYLDEYVEKALSQAKRNSIVYGVLMIDIDYFKMVNDTHGHDVGDRAIKALSKILKESIREADTAFRFGGEEFLILLYQCDEAMVEHVADKIRTAFEKTPIQANNGSSFYKTLSVGASIFPHDSDSLWKCIKFADIALYAAKEDGRNCVKVFGSQMVEDKEMKGEF